MKLQKFAAIVLGCLSFATLAHANEITLKTNEPTKIVIRVAHQMKNRQPIYGEVETLDVNKNGVTIPVNLNNYDYAGIVILSANGHPLPASANTFDKAQQCSMTTDKSNSKGTLEFELSQHKIDCRTLGGIFT